MLEYRLYFTCNNTGIKITSDNIYVTESGLSITKYLINDTTTSYCYFTDVTPSYVEFISTFEEEMRKMDTEERKEELSRQFNDVVKENLYKENRCIQKEMEMLNRLFSEDIEKDVIMDIITNALQLN